MAIRFVEFSNGANCGIITKDVLKKFSEVIAKHIFANISASFKEAYRSDNAKMNERIEQECFDDGNNIAYYIHRVRISRNIDCFAWIYDKFISGVLYSSRDGNQKHESIQIIVSKCLFEYLNEHKDLQRELNTLYPDREIKIKSEPEYHSLELVIADIEVKNQQRLAILPRSNFRKIQERSVKVFSQQFFW